MEEERESVKRTQQSAAAAAAATAGCMGVLCSHVSGRARPLLALGSVGVYPATAETLVEPLGASLLQWTLHVSLHRLQLLRQMRPFITAVGGWGCLWVLVMVIDIIF